MKLIILTNEPIFEGNANLLNKLFHEGMQLLHLRKPLATKVELEHLLNEIDPVYRSQIVLHDHFGLLDPFRLKRIHLNSRTSIRPSLADIISISRSCHSFESIKASMDNHDYMFLSPIFDSISKAGYNHAFTEEQLNDAILKNLINDKVIALGGITPETIPIAARYKFGGVAVLGSLWGNYLRDRDEAALLQRFFSLQTITAKL